MVILAAIGVLVVLVTLVDVFVTTISMRNAGPLSSRLMENLWRPAATSTRFSHEALEIYGSLMLLLAVVCWGLLVYIGWALVFLAAPDAVHIAATRRRSAPTRRRAAACDLAAHSEPGRPTCTAAMSQRRSRRSDASAATGRIDDGGIGSCTCTAGAEEDDGCPVVGLDGGGRAITRATPCRAPAATGSFDGLQAELARIPHVNVGLVKLPDGGGGRAGHHAV